MQAEVEHTTDAQCLKGGPSASESVNKAARKELEPNDSDAATPSVSAAVCGASEQNKMQDTSVGESLE